MMTKYIIGISLVVLLFAMLFIPSAAATEENYCTSANDLVIVTNITSCITDAGVTTCKMYYSTDVTNCPYACDNVTRSCNPPPYQVNLIMIGIAAVIMLTIGMIIKRK